MKLGWSYPKRRQFIDQLEKSPHATKNKHPLVFPDKLDYFQIYNVPIDMPKYRLANGRTIAQQEQFIKENNKPEDFFEKDIELEDAQRAQHSILKTFLKPDDKDEKVNLIKYFMKNDQTEPLILDHNGFVVNGNRRLCAMREINQVDKSTSLLTPRFNYVDVIILPPCEEKAILVLEARLQIIQDIKSDYDWTAQAVNYRVLINKYKLSVDEVANIYDKKKEEIQDALIILTYVDEYLVSRGFEKQYNRVLKEKFAFESIFKTRKKVKGDEKKSIFTSISYNLIDSDKEGLGRLYSYIPKVADHMDPIVDKIGQELPYEGQQFQFSNEEDLGWDLLDDEDIDQEAALLDLAKTISKKENRETVLHIVKDVIDEVEEDRKRFTVLDKLQRANAHVQEAINIFDTKTEKGGVKEQLSSLEDKIKILYNKLQEPVENVVN